MILFSNLNSSPLEIKEDNSFIYVESIENEPFKIDKWDVLLVCDKYIHTNKKID